MGTRARAPLDPTDARANAQTHVGREDELRREEVALRDLLGRAARIEIEWKSWGDTFDTDESNANVARRIVACAQRVHRLRELRQTVQSLRAMHREARRRSRAHRELMAMR
jgi:hypothetical protein